MEDHPLDPIFALVPSPELSREEENRLADAQAFLDQAIIAIGGACFSRPNATVTCAQDITAAALDLTKARITAQGVLRADFAVATCAEELPGALYNYADGATMTELARDTEHTEDTVSWALRLLCRQGTVERAPTCEDDAVDGDSLRWRLTERGASDFPGPSTPLGEGSR